MKKVLLLAGWVAVMLLPGCSSTPSPGPETPPTLFEEMQNQSETILEAGGLATIGSGTSASLELARNRALINGRIELARALDKKIETLKSRLIEETELPPDAEILSRFNTAARTITGQKIAVSPAQRIEQETAEGTFTVHALMVLSPSAITGQLAEDRDLFALLRPSKVFEELEKEAADFDARRDLE